MDQPKFKIGIIGIGMVGTPLKRYFEEGGYQRGRNLFLFDIDKKKGFEDDINKAEIIFISVPTPKSKKGQADLTAVEDAFKRIKGGKVVVVKSTVPPGSAEYFQRKYPRLKVLFNPEFLTERRSWEDMINPDRQIAGYTQKSRDMASAILNLLPTAFFSSPGVLETYDFTRINATEAEAGKYAGNLFGALKVTFGNIVKDWCDSIEIILSGQKIKTRVDYENVRKMVAHDRRIGGSWLDVDHGNYRGYGGYCFVKDTEALIYNAKESLKKIPAGSREHKRLQKGITFLEAMREYNKTLLETQGLTLDDVSVHDREWVAKKLNKKS